MVKSEVVIDEAWCKGCGLCVYFCPRGCIEMTKDKLGPQGNLLPVFNHPENCNTCGICTRMCPDLAIEVYVSLEEEPLVIT
ncbi:MAG TPA: 4Fe-4S binding protein [Dehalococcoidia bacterium]|nr:4Fe-4S binding protein [Dehalococcoidia bacterium]